MKPLSLVGLVLLSLANALGAYDLSPLTSNGRNFLQDGSVLPLRCVDESGLLTMSPADRDLRLDQAAAAGFNAVGFVAQLYGEGGLCRKLGTVEEGWRQNFKATLEACGRRRLYAVPLLWPRGAVEAFSRDAGGEDLFYSGKNQLAWQAWLLRQALESDPGQLTRSAQVGAWLLWRGPWPGSATAQGQQAVTASAQALRAWLGWQVSAARRLGVSQLIGAGAWPKSDLSSVPGQALVEAPAPAGQLEVLDISSIPPTDPSRPVLGLEEELAREKALDSLPAVPGSVTGTAEITALTPWDLEGLDWDGLEQGLGRFPMASQLDFLEFTLDTEDWYRVGTRLADAVQAGAEVPVCWRQDWRNASRYERQKHLEAPEPLAGLIGPWPDDDWPGEGETIWPPATGKALQALQIRRVALEKGPQGLLLILEFNRPALVEVGYGPALPLAHTIRNKIPVPSASLLLKQAPKKGYFLVKVQASSARWGKAIARTRWLRLDPAPADKGKP